MGAGASSKKDGEEISPQQLAHQANRIHELSQQLEIKELEIKGLRAKLLAAANSGARPSIVNMATDTGGHRNSLYDRMKKKRRGEVSAEVGDNNDQENVSMQPLTFEKHEKSARTTDLIANAVENNIMFQGIGKEEKKDLIQAFFKVEISKGACAIKEGDVGDNFYVVEEGKLDILVTISATTNQTANYGSLFAGQCFGELALMYNTPRAATIKAKTRCVLWAICRSVFSKIHLHHKLVHTKKYETYLRNVPELKHLTKSEMSKIANAVSEQEFEKGEVIIREGELGNHFYMIESGKVEYSKTEKGVVGNGYPGDYFGHKALLTEEKRQATVTAVQNTTCLILHRSMFVSVLGRLQDLLNRENIVEETPTEENVENKYHKDIEFKDLQLKFKHRQKEKEIILGQGAFGKVQIVKHIPTGETYALKCLAKNQIVSRQLEAHVFDERKVMNMIDHQFLLKFHNSYWDKKYVYFLLELCLGGELFQILRKARRFKESAARFYVAAVVKAFEHMHAKHIIYRDLKPENIMLDDRGYVKVVDFGLAKVVTTKTWTCCGTPDYLAPEIITTQGHDKAADYWALGVLIYELVTGHAPYFMPDDPLDTYQLILRGEIKFEQRLTSAIQDLIKGLNKVNQAKRLGNTKEGIQGIIQHIWFAGFDWQALLDNTMSPPYKPKVADREDTSNFEDYPEDKTKVKDCNWRPNFPTELKDF